MNWFDTSGLTSLAKTALKEAQKTIDKALDIQDESGEEKEDEAATVSQTATQGSSNTLAKENSDFFSSWGLTVSADSSKENVAKQHAVVTESPTKSNSQSLWGSFAGSFFEQSTITEMESAIVRPPKAKSMNVISDTKFGSQDDLFSKSQLVMSDSGDADLKNLKNNEVSKVDERRDSSRSNRLSLVSSRNSSDSVEVLSQSLKTTPDSEAMSAQSLSHSSSVGLKLNSDSVEILPDSLISPSSIECLGFDSYSSDKSTSSNLTPGDVTNKKVSPGAERTEKPDTADSVSLVADDDDDTMSYNSISECTAPTVLDTDEKPVSPFPRTVRTEPMRKTEKELIHLEQPLIQQRMQLSENSSNDGSWSDRTLHADNDSINLENVEEPKKEVEQEDLLMEKLSDSSSFYNVNVSSDMARSESSAFVNIEKQQCNATDSSDSSHKECSIKERTSPTSSDSKSDLVKIGSDRTSGHTSGDELETATSSDIEIIPSPNGDNHGFCRNSPAKYAFKQSKFDGTTSPNLVDLVLGKSLATKIRGHNRELSEASIQSNTSDESQGSENERLMRRLGEMAEILEARENRLMEVSRSNAELAETNADLKSQVETLMAKHETGDISTITEDYTQRMSALEKKFQQAIREKDQLRKQLDSFKSESSLRKNFSELENTLKEKEEVIAQLQEEGEKLSRQQLQHSNIIKKLRAKEKDNEQVIKSLRDKIAEQTSEVDRLKRSVAAKEELEVTQIEAVYRLTTANKKLESDLAETRSALEDSVQRLETAQTSLEGARRELVELQRSSAELQRRRDAAGDEAAARRRAETERDALRAQLDSLRAEMLQEEKRWISREEALRRELREARELWCAEGGGGGGGGEGGAGAGTGALLEQLAALQRAALCRDQAHSRHLAAVTHQREQAERALAAAVERERATREESAELRERLAEAEGRLRELQGRLRGARGEMGRLQGLEAALHSKNAELEHMKSEYEAKISELETRLSETEQVLANEKLALETEKKRNAILQEQVSVRGDVSPHSVASDSFSASLWPSEEGSSSPARCGASMGGVGVGVGGGGGAVCVETTLANLTRREGETRALLRERDGLTRERDALRDALAAARAALDDAASVQEQYDALLQMYGEKEEQLEEVRLDLQDVTQLYKAQLDELLALKHQLAAR